MQIYAILPIYKGQKHQTPHYLSINSEKKIMAQNSLEARRDALSDAISEKNGAKVQAILDATARVAEINHRIMKDALHQAIGEAAPTSIVKILVDAKADLNQLDFYRGLSPLHYATWKEKDHTAILLEAKANPNTLNRGKRTPLQFLCSEFYAIPDHFAKRQYEIVQLLLQFRADPWAFAFVGTVPLLSSDNGDTPVELLLTTVRDTPEKLGYATQITQLLLESMGTALDVAANKAFNRPRIIATMTGEHPRAGARSLHRQATQSIYDRQVWRKIFDLSNKKDRAQEPITLDNLAQKKEEYKKIKTKLSSRSYTGPTLFANPLDTSLFAAPAQAAPPHPDEPDKHCLIM